MEAYELTLLDLPVLDSITQLLPTRDRALLFSASRKLREFAHARPWLYADVRVDLRSPIQAAHFAHWLATRPGGTLQRLALTTLSGEVLGEQIGLWAQANLAGWSGLTSLKLHINGSLSLGAWLASLPLLEDLTVRCWGGQAHPALHLEGGLATVTSLRCLRLLSPASLPPPPLRCFPRELREAEMWYPAPAVIPALVAAAAGDLRRLVLVQSTHSPEDLEPLASLPNLTALTLATCRLTCVPAVLHALSGLQELSLAANRLEAGGWGWNTLLGLVRLRELDLSWQQGSLCVPGELLSMPELQVLNLPYCGRATVLTPPTAPCALRRLSLDVEAAARSHPCLSALTSLQLLELATRTGKPAMGPWPAVGVCLGAEQATRQQAAQRPGAQLAGQDILQLLRALARLARSGSLRAVMWIDQAGAKEQFAVGNSAQLAALIARITRRYPAVMTATLRGRQQKDGLAV